MEALTQCWSGCKAPPQAPSKVLCKECLEKLDKRMKLLHIAERVGPLPTTVLAVPGLKEDE